MARKLFVGSLDYGVTDEQLKEMFQEFGTVTSAQVILDRETRRSRGFGFVEFENDEEAKAAIDALDGKEHQGRNLVVNEARSKN